MRPLRDLRLTPWVVLVATASVLAAYFVGLNMVPSWRFDLGSYVLGALVFGFPQWLQRYWRNRV